MIMQDYFIETLFSPELARKNYRSPDSGTAADTKKKLLEIARSRKDDWELCNIKTFSVYCIHLFSI